MTTGIDIVYIPELEKRLKRIDLAKVFLPIEISQNKSMENLAGIFAAKEAFFKAKGRKENWLDVWIEKDRKGKPKLYSPLLSAKEKAAVSISHANLYAISIIIIKET